MIKWILNALNTMGIINQYIEALINEFSSAKYQLEVTQLNILASWQTVTRAGPLPSDGPISTPVLTSNNLPWRVYQWHGRLLSRLQGILNETWLSNKTAYHNKTLILWVFID